MSGHAEEDQQLAEASMRPGQEAPDEGVSGFGSTV